MTGADAEPAGARRRLPLGIQTFREIREGGYYYVDKTRFIQRLLDLMCQPSARSLTPPAKEGRANRASDSGGHPVGKAPRIRP